ncbi:FCD domain-containing protein [Halotalea alkalilenta]|uniref:FCD domain-containing protein n=1 Tax=Halotalea alkalilenta TaxID=376489 RepID=UPI000487767F|nr:FCD domain-containing protein [Halotalea alkalilenta]
MAQRQYQHIAARLKQELTDQTFVVGTRLPTERDYAQRFEVSRTVVREAFIMLEIEGWVEVRKGSGTYLLERPARSPADGDEEIGPFELLDARQVVESAIAAHAAQRISKAELLALSSLLERERELLAREEAGQRDFEAADSTDQAFHLGIARASQNAMLVEIAQRLWEQRRSTMWRRLHGRILDFSYRGEWLEHHQRILAMLRKRDEEGARDAMWNHIERVKEVLFALSDTDDPGFDGFLFDTPTAAH